MEQKALITMQIIVTAKEKEVIWTPSSLLFTKRKKCDRRY
jgi:hypothetical protein